MKIAAIQFDVLAGQPQQNRQRAERLILEAAAKGAELLLLPELWNCGYQLENLPALAESLRGESISLLRKLAKQHQLVIVSGSIAEKKEGKYYNTSTVIDAKGEIAAKYRKVHLYPHGLNEHLHFSPGDRWVIAEQSGLQIGLMICYDTFFPEFARNLVLRGAQLLTIPSQSTVKPLHLFQTLTVARAVENQCYVIFANCSASRCGEEDDSLGGHSMIISPRGEILAQAGREESVLVADLDFSLLHWLAENRSYLNDRRPILDELDNGQL